MTERASGWYDDPQDPTLLRYWDGILWSDRTMPKVKPGLEQSRIGDARRQYEEEQERLRQAELERQGYPRGGQQRPQLRPYQEGQQNPYGYQQVSPRPVKTAPDGEPTASWWRRLFAYIIDNILLTGVALAASWPWLKPWADTVSGYWSDIWDAAQNQQAQPPVPSGLYDVPWQFPVIMLVIYLVYEIGLVAWRGQTLGHQICGIRVRGAESTAKPTLEASAIRAVVKGVDNITGLVPLLGSLGSVFNLIDGLVPLGDRSAQSIHDKAAKTYVVRSSPRGR